MGKRTHLPIGNFVRIAMLILMLAFPSLYMEIHAKYSIVNDEDGKGFTVTFNSSKDVSELTSNKEFEGNFEEGDIGTKYPISVGIEDSNNTGLNIYFYNCYGNNHANNFDFGFTSSSKFIIKGNLKKSKYVKSITINWNTNYPSALDLRVFGMTNKDGKNPYNNNTSNISELEKLDNDIDAILIRGENESSTYVFNKPIIYMVLTTSVTSSTSFARFSSFSIHFRDEFESAPIDFVWKNGDKTLSNTGSNGNPAITFNYGAENIVNFNINEGDSEQGDLNNVDLSVKYRRPNSTTKADIQTRRAGTPDDSENPNLPDEEGYINASEEAYTLNKESHTIAFNIAGDYKITPIFSDNSSNSTSINPLYVTVVAAEPTVSIASTTIPFYNSNGNYKFEVGVENAILSEKDFTVTLVPYSSDWQTSYESLPSYFVTEKDRISRDYIIDGIYSEDYQKDIKIESSNDNGFYISVPYLPCSGHYILKILPSDNINVRFSEDSNYEADIYIYPTALNDYGVYDNNWVAKFNVNGVYWTALTSSSSYEANDYSGEILYPYIGEELFMASSLQDSHIYTPGVYLADMKVKIKPILTSQHSKRGATDNPTLDDESDSKLDEEYTDYQSTATIDLSKLKNSNLAIYIYLSKNGAHTPVENDGNSKEGFLITASKDNTIPTGIDTITSDDSSEAIYYNLQGTRIQNPEHGIFIKITNGNASKVVM